MGITKQQYTKINKLILKLHSLLNTKHFLDVDILDKEKLSLLINLSKEIKLQFENKSNTFTPLKGKILANLFFESSTRTKLSFEIAGKLLGAHVINFSKKESSTEKGESLISTIQTIESLGADFIIIRHADSGAPYAITKTIIKSSIINAGDGQHAHPTQALTDAFTLKEHLVNLEGKKMVIVGDINHSRVFRSNLWTLTSLGINIVIDGPQEFLPNFDLIKTLPPKIKQKQITIEHNLEKALKNADIIMPLRIQKERHLSKLNQNLKTYISQWQINETKLKLAKPNALIMHPGPVNEGIEINANLINSPQSLIQKQVENGVFCRMAILLSCNKDFA